MAILCRAAKNSLRGTPVHKGAKNKEQRTQIKYTSLNGVLLLYCLKIISTVCSSSDLVVSVSFLCV
jgi:hypothetical protein